MRQGGVVLSGHIEVVPVDGQIWSSDPFRLPRATTACTVAALPIAQLS
jgi:acetylornithine deacetylase/succinyl-diaminopimelate desuccinylase-like protein